MGETMKCALCGEPMPQGEEMFKFHGYSGPCPAPPLPRKPSEVEQLRAELAAARAEVEALTRDRDGWERRTKEIGSVVIRSWALLRDWWQYAQLEEREEPFVDALARALAADQEHDAYALAEIRRWRDVAGEAARLRGVLEEVREQLKFTGVSSALLPMVNDALAAQEGR